jgi:hypothetical protein
MMASLVVLGDASIAARRRCGLPAIEFGDGGHDRGLVVIRLHDKEICLAVIVRKIVLLLDDDLRAKVASELRTEAALRGLESAECEIAASCHCRYLSQSQEFDDERLRDAQHAARLFINDVLQRRGSACHMTAAAFAFNPANV